MLLKVDEMKVGAALRELEQKLDGDGVIVDFSGVHHLDSNALAVMQEVARKADEKAVKIVLRNVSVDVYKVLKLIGLDSQFSFSG